MFFVNKAADSLMDMQPERLYMEAWSIVGRSVAAFLFSNPASLKKSQCKKFVVLNSILN